MSRLHMGAVVCVVFLSDCEHSEVETSRPFTSALQQTLVVLPDARPMPPFSLTRGRGQLLSRADLLGHWTLIEFGYLSCPDVCPTTLARLGKGLKLLNSEPHPESVRGLFVSVDIARDTPERTQGYAEFYGASIGGVTGSREQVDILVHSLDASYTIGSNSQKQYSVAHSTALFVIDPQARWVATLPHPDSPQQIAMDISRLRSPLAITHAAVRLSPPQAPATAGFFTLKNHSSLPQTIISVHSPAFERVEMHHTELRDGVATMRAESRLSVPPGHSVKFAPKGRHLMLYGAGRRLREGELLSFVLTLQSQRRVHFQAVVSQP